MSTGNPVQGRAVVVQPEEGASFWQPVPANGHADPKLTPASTGYDGLSMGYQTIAPGGRVREHSHGDQIELQICFRRVGDTKAVLGHPWEAQRPTSKIGKADLGRRL